MKRAGVIHNPKSRHNRGAPAPVGSDAVLVEAPRGRQALDETLARFATERLDLLVIDGGDGTVREVLTRAPRHFTDGLPALAVLPSGKTNALAFDLGAPPGWSIKAALGCAREGRFRSRRPLEVFRPGQAAPLVRGFIFGAGAFVRATDLAQRTHRLGAFEEAAVGLTLGGAVFRTLFGGPRSGWRAGEPMRISTGEAAPYAGDVFLLLASTLERLPLGVQPLGPPDRGRMRSLAVEAPPRRLLQALPRLLSGAETPWLAQAGYHQRVDERIDVALDTSFVLDGETFPGGELSLRLGAPLQFVTP
ncbi:MAG TPA: diacylglycerol kinase family protein [Phenylobacterium sp.]|uniref:diacylglycerol/lipid kinase family protein n=1 Tax=Phenylobacterium sp. TaxID=1871053 RepID=UPI002B4A7E65|nr:diacylglycerol kinase family protein [Phenylobacterium sp.]HKR89689.1 diacylglycerol kinase family protein [Phenylobacterium sp.]